MQVHTFRIPGWGRVQIPADDTVALVSGEVPRLVVRDGSDSFDLWEGQSLPVTGRGRSAYLYNPFQRDVVVYVGFGLPVRFGNSPADIAARHYEKTAWIVPFNGVAAHATNRIGVGILPLKGKMEITLAAEVAGRIRVSAIHGADPAFLATKPGTVMASAVSVRGQDAIYDGVQQCLSIYGSYFEPDAQAWIAANPTVNMSIYHVKDTAARVVARPDVAVFLSRYPNESFEGALTLRELGLSAEDFD